LPADRKNGGGGSLAEMLLWLSDPRLRDELESFRIAYEAEYGETDLTRRYTSTWPTEKQLWMIEHETKRYFDGLPPFAKAYLKRKMDLTARAGNLDDMPATFLSLYVTGRMRTDDEGDGAGR
jgi:hypothetical protein